MNNRKHILAGVDFSERSEAALHQAVRMAHWNEAHSDLLHCVEYLTLGDSACASHIPHEKLEQDVVAAARQTLSRWLKDSGAAPDAQVLVDVGAPIGCVLRLGGAVRYRSRQVGSRPVSANSKLSS